MKEYEVICDRMTVGMRSIKLKMDGFLINILYNPQTDDTHITFKQPDPFGPDINYVEDRFVLTYKYVVIPENFRDDFEGAYHRTLHFCDSIKPVLEELMEKMQKETPNE